MQGVDDLDAIYALPLEGIPELGTGYAATDPDSEELTWTIAASNPAIGAGFQDETLYIWGADASWSGYGEVTLSVEDNTDGRDSITIPVTVFSEDKTLINGAGKKDYFVPWSPDLDINRIVSVEEHMQTYSKDEGNLDRTIKWARWKKMEYIKGAQVVGWTNSNTFYAWTEASQYLLVDNTFVELANIGCNGINYWRMYALESMDAPFPTEVFDGSSPALSITDDDLRYLINEAHRNGFQAIITSHVAELLGTQRDQITPPSFPIWFNHYGQLVRSNASICQETGAEGVVVGNILYLPSPIYWGLITNAQWNNFMLNILADDIRRVYSGPAIYMPGCQVNGDFRDLLPLLGEVDIVGGNSNFPDYPVGENPTVGQVARHIADSIREFISPINATLNKPMLMNEGGLISQRDGLRLMDLIGIASESAIYDGEEQRIWYEAYLNAESEFDYIFGFGWFFWQLFPGAGGVGSIGYAPRLKPAEAEIRNAYLPGSSPPIIQIDGEFDDWLGKRVSYEDPEGDSSSISSDIVRIRSERDEDYHYLLLEFAGAFNQDYAVQLLFDLDNDFRTDLLMNLTYHKEWFAMLFEDISGLRARGRADIESNQSESQFELRFHNSLLKNVPNFQVGVKVLDRTGTAIDVINFFPLHESEPDPDQQL
jgi:hypothetical protein